MVDQLLFHLPLSQPTTLSTNMLLSREAVLLANSSRKLWWSLTPVVMFGTETEWCDNLSQRTAGIDRLVVQEIGDTTA